MKVAALQLDIAWESRELNYRRVMDFALKAKGEGAELLVLPEMFSTGFSMNVPVTAETADGPTPTFLQELALKHEMHVIGGYVEQAEGGKGRNVALTVSKGGEVLSKYAKSHLFSFADEDDHHVAGTGPEAVQVGDILCSAFICYDLRFPEIFRLTAASSHLHVVIASWPAARQRHWDMLLPARAIENQLYTLGVNRVGRGGGLDYTGGTVLYDPLGDCLGFASDYEQLMISEVDADVVEEGRRNFSALEDRRF